MEQPNASALFAIAKPILPSPRIATLLPLNCRKITRVISFSILPNVTSGSAYILMLLKRVITVSSVPSN
jgi:hypothetical protein